MSIELKEVKEIDNKDLGDEQIEWEPASNLQNVLGLDLENFVYRWVNRADPENFARKLQQGWVIDSEIDGSKVEHKRANKLETGANLTPSIKENRGVILMKMRKPLAEARKRYYQKRADEQLRMVTDRVKQEGRGTIYGEIKVSKGI